MLDLLDEKIWLDHFWSEQIRVDTRLTVSEWAEQKRFLPVGISPMPGPFRWEVTPYLREIADCFSESSPIQHVAIMKGAQLGFTVGILENVLGYIIDACPGPTMFLSADKTVAEQSVELRVDRMIESAGLSRKIFSQSEKRSNKKTGDTKSKKEFAGGFLLAVGPNSGAKLRMISIKYMLRDEVDAYPQEVSKEGDPIKLTDRRTDAFESVRKILDISTPLLDHTSRIKLLFKKGDQRYYNVPCLKCGTFQILKWDHMHYKQDEMGRLVWSSVFYECDKCNQEMKNSDKAEFLGYGEWVPTVKPMEPNYRSYHLASFYSPVGMRSWESICQEWITVKEDPVMLQVFVNTVFGETWVEKGEAPQWPRVMLKREGYETGTCPGEAYFLTVGADVQKDRIEIEIVAWGKDKESWSIDYIVLPGLTEDIGGEVWTKLYNLLIADHAGLPAKMAFIDAGYNTSTVYEFCDQFGDGVVPVMGDNRVGVKGKPYTLGDLKPKGYHVKRVNLNTHTLKQALYANLQKGKPEKGQPYPSGFCHFPLEYGQKYFQQLMSEEFYPEKTKTGKIVYSWHLKSGRRNEAHDCRIYAMGALEYFATTAWEQTFPNDEFVWSGQDVSFWEWAEKGFPEN